MAYGLSLVRLSPSVVYVCAPSTVSAYVAPGAPLTDTDPDRPFVTFCDSETVPELNVQFVSPDVPVTVPG